MRERGSALLVAIVSVMVLLLISGVFFSLITDQMKSNSYEERAIKSYYLAQAGLFYGVAKLKSGFVPELFVTSDGKKRSAVEPHDDPFEYGGQFTVQWEEYESGYKIYSTGSYGEDTGQVDRTLQGYYKTSATGGTPGDIPEEYLIQELLVDGDYGDGNSKFVFSNVIELGDTLPVYLNQGIYIFLTNKSGKIRKSSMYTHNVRLSLQNSDEDTIDLTDNIKTKNVDDEDVFLPRDTAETGYKYMIPNFIEGSSEKIFITYTGNEKVRLVVEGYISNKADDYDETRDQTGTIVNIFVISTDDGLIWQIEQ